MFSSKTRVEIKDTQASSMIEAPDEKINCAPMPYSANGESQNDTDIG